MAKIIAPNEKFNGKRAGVAFVDGHAETDDEEENQGDHDPGKAAVGARVAAEQA